MIKTLQYHHAHSQEYAIDSLPIRTASGYRYLGLIADLGVHPTVSQAVHSVQYMVQVTYVDLLICHQCLPDLICVHSIFP